MPGGFLPDLATIAAVIPVAAALALIAASFVAWLRVARGVAAPYTRKTFHFVIVSAAMFVQLRWGFHGTIVYGSVIATAVLIAVARGAGNPFYEALARPSDEPHRTLYVLVPLATTALGGLLANLWFPDWAHVGYMAVAWGDAVGEPVGTRWGRHRYRVPSLAGVVATRSIQGSAAVLVAATAAAFIAVSVAGVRPVPAAVAALAVGLGTTIVEAVSHHGLDNLTIQIAASAIAAVLLGG
jgi:phytol kinase